MSWLDALGWLGLALGIVWLILAAHPATGPFVRRWWVAYVFAPIMVALSLGNLLRRKPAVELPAPRVEPAFVPTESEVRAIRRDGRTRASALRAELDEVEDLKALEDRAAEELRRAGLLP